jgi:hypothetical protein
MTRTQIFIVIALFISTVGQSQDLYTTTELDSANTAKNADYLTDTEKQVILYMNLARMDGSRFYKAYIPQYIEEYNQTYSPTIDSTNSYLISLWDDLSKIENQPMLLPHPKLSTSATYHASDMGKTGDIGHLSSNGNSFWKRILKYYPDAEYVTTGENCSYGYSDAIGIVCQLLLDDNVPSLGHRKNILSTTFYWVGVSIAPHKKYDFNCVMDFAGK